MIESIYILYTIFSFIIFLIGITDVFKLQKKTRVLVLVIAFLFFLIITFSSFSIDTMHCHFVESSGEWECAIYSVMELELVGVNILFMILSVISAITLMLYASEEEATGGKQ